MLRAWCIVSLLLALTACNQDRPEPAPVEATPDAVRPAPALAPPLSPVEAPNAPARHVLQVGKPELLLSLHRQRSLALTLEASPATAMSIVQVASGLVRARIPIGRERIQQAASIPDGWVALTRSHKLLKLSFEGETSPLPTPSCLPEQLYSDVDGTLLLLGADCAAVGHGAAWTPIPLESGERPVMGSIVATRSTLFLENGPGACRLLRTSPAPAGSAPAGSAPAGSSPAAQPPAAQPPAAQPPAAQPPAAQPPAAPSSGAAPESAPAPSAHATPGESAPASGSTEAQSGYERLPWEGSCPSLATLDAEGTLYAGSPERGFRKLASVAGATWEPLAGIPPLLGAALQPHKKRLLGLSQEKRLVEFSLSDGAVLELSALPESAKRLQQGVQLWAPEDSGLLAMGMPVGALEQNILRPALLLDEERWLELPGWQTHPTLQICATAWIPEQDALLAVALELSGEVIKTHMLSLEPGSGRLKPFAVGSDPKAASPAECLLTPSPDGKVAAVYSGSSVKLIDLETRQRVGKSTQPGVLGLAFSADSGSLYVATREGGVKRGEVPALEDPTPITRYDQGLQAVSSLTEGDLILFATPAGAGTRVELMTGERQQVLGSLNLSAPVKSVSLGQKGARMALGLGAQGLQLWTLPSNKAVPLSQSPAELVSLTPDGSSVAWAEATLSARTLGKQSNSWEQALLSPAKQLSWASRRRCLSLVDALGGLSLWSGSGVRTLELYALSAEHWILHYRNEGWRGSLDRPDRLWRIFPNLKESIVSLPAPAAQAGASAQSECGVF